jgi:hypothetical protein
VIASAQGLAYAAVPGWVAEQCRGAPEPCVRALVIDAPGEFAASAALIDAVTTGPGFRRLRPLVRFPMPER